jgi:hypothetical protein
VYIYIYIHVYVYKVVVAPCTSRLVCICICVFAFTLKSCSSCVHHSPCVSAKINTPNSLKTSASACTAQDLAIQIGVDCGEVAAGVIGILQPRFHAHGAVMANAQKLESQCLPGSVLISPRVSEIISGGVVSATLDKGMPMARPHAVIDQQESGGTHVRYNQVPRKNSTQGSAWRSVCAADKAISDRYSAALNGGAKSRAFDVVLSTRNVCEGEQSGAERRGGGGWGGGGGGGKGSVGREAAVWKSKAFAGDWLDSECQMCMYVCMLVYHACVWYVIYIYIYNVYTHTHTERLT